MGNPTVNLFVLDIEGNFRGSYCFLCPDLDGEVSGSSPGHTKDFINDTYCSSACAGHNELE